MEEWQDPDSGYLNCIGVGDSYVKKQIARILNQNTFKAAYVSYFPHGDSIDVWTDKAKFEKKELCTQRKTF